MNLSLLFLAFEEIVAGWQALLQWRLGERVHFMCKAVFELCFVAIKLLFIFCRASRPTAAIIRVSSESCILILCLIYCCVLLFSFSNCVVQCGVLGGARCWRHVHTFLDLLYYIPPPFPLVAFCTSVRRKNVKERAPLIKSLLNKTFTKFDQSI